MISDQGFLNNYKEFDTSECNSKEELTLITANNMTERTQSVIDDDVGSDGNLDYYPVKENLPQYSYKCIKSPDPIEIIDIQQPIQIFQDNSHILKCGDSIDSLKYNYKNNSPTIEVDKYNLEPYHNGFDDSYRYRDEMQQTVRYIPQPSVILTKHEKPQLKVENRFSSPYSNPNYDPHTSVSPATTDIGKQITQLARRIESLGNISRLYQDDVENHRINSPSNDCYQVQETNPLISDEQSMKPHCHSIKVERKLDEISRLQKKQEAMQNRLVDLAKKLNDSTRDLSHLPNASPTHNGHISSDEYFHAKIIKPTKKPKKKPDTKGFRPSKKGSKQVPTSSFLKNILNDVNESKANEMPLLSSNYCLHNDISSGTTESGISESTSKYLNDELANIRREFRNQVEEIKKLLSDRYQNSMEFAKQNQKIQCMPESVMDSYVKPNLQKFTRDVSPSLRNITNINNNNSEECPLDKYLVKNNKAPELPSLNVESTPSLRPGILPSVARAIKSKQRMLSDPVEAEKFLNELSNRRTNLESNLNCIERNKEGDFLFSILEKLQGNEKSVDLARIQAMVDDAITSVTPIVNQEVNREFSNWLEKRKKLKEQQLLAEEEEKQFLKKVKCKPVKFNPNVNYNIIPSSSSVPNKQWVCKKYLAVGSKIDSGVRKPTDRTISKVQRSQSPPKQTVLSTQPDNYHPTYSNRRRYRTPYLHFANDIKLAKKSVNPLGSGASNIPIIDNFKDKHMLKKFQQVKDVTDDGPILISVKQYSLNYFEDEKNIEPLSKPILATKSTSPQSISEPKQNNSELKNLVSNQSDKSDDIHFQLPPESITKPTSPTFSEKGTGFEVMSKISSKPREERVGPFAPFDPTETTRLSTHPIHVLMQNSQIRPGNTNVEPDLNNLRYIIERALLDQIQIPSPPQSSRDQSDTLTRADHISTPLPTENGDCYSSHFSEQEQDDRTLTAVDGFKTPDASQMISDHSFRPSRLSTPSQSLVSSRKASTPRPHKTEMVSEAVQTIRNNAVQTDETKEVQTCPPTTATQTPKIPKEPQSTESYSTTSDFNDSLSDTQAHSFSDGMWLYDRSEGEMAPYQIENVDRWRLGSCPDNPLWFNGTEDIVNMDRKSNLSFGEFTKPILPGLIPTQDPVLQLKTIPFKPILYEPDREEEDFIYMRHHQQPLSPNFRSVGVSRDSKSKFTTPRNYENSPTNFNDSEGEVMNYNDEYADSFGENDAADDDPDDLKVINPVNQSFEEYKHPSPHLMNIMRQSQQSGGRSDPGSIFRDSYSDRMNIDLNRYLRGSRQSQSDTSDGAGLMSTGQIVASAFRGGDSADFDGYSEYGTDNYRENQTPVKHTVKIPTLGTVEQSSPSNSDDNLEIINIEN